MMRVMCFTNTQYCFSLFWFLGTFTGKMIFQVQGDSTIIKTRLKCISCVPYIVLKQPAFLNEMAVALFIPSFSTNPAGQLHCQAVIELSFSAPAQEDSSSDEFVTFTTKEAKTGIFAHRWGYGYFPRAHRLSLLLTKRVSLFAA